MSVANADDSRPALIAEPRASDEQSADRAFHRRKSFRVAVFLLLYVGSYSILFMTGEYRWRPSGEHRYAFGMAMFELSLWCPSGMHWERRKSISGEYLIDADPLGWFYLPLIAADRRWFHPTTSVFDALD